MDPVFKRIALANDFLALQGIFPFLFFRLIIIAGSDIVKQGKNSVNNPTRTPDQRSVVP